MSQEAIEAFIMDIERRSGCPINLTLEVLGDRWSLVIIRDIMFGNRRNVAELLSKSDERIPVGILAVRLKRLASLGLISTIGIAGVSNGTIFSLTEAGIQLVSTLANIAAWGNANLPVGNDKSMRIELLEEGGPALWDEIMDDLRRIHLSDPIAGSNGSLNAPTIARFTTD